MSHWLDRYPGHPQLYYLFIEPYFLAARRAYPHAIERDGSTWVLAPSAVDGSMLVLHENPHDGGLEPIQHLTFWCDADDLCVACHRGYGNGLCRWHWARYYAPLWWYVGCGVLQAVVGAVEEFIDRHLVLKLTMLLVQGLLMCYALSWCVGVAAYGDPRPVITAGIIGVALAYVVVSSMAILAWREQYGSKRSGEEGEYEDGEGEG